MALPISRNTTYAGGSPIKPIDLDDLQDQIVRLESLRAIAESFRTEIKTMPIPANAGSPADSSDAYSSTAGDGIINCDSWIIPIVGIDVGARIVGVNAHIRDSVTGPTKLLVGFVRVNSLDGISSGEWSHAASNVSANFTLGTVSRGQALTGDGPYQLTTTGTLPAGYALATSYWLIRVDANNSKLALSYANAIAGIYVATTTNGSGVHTLSPVYPWAAVLTSGSGSDQIISVTGERRIVPNQKLCVSFPKIGSSATRVYGLDVMYRYD